MVLQDKEGKRDELPGETRDGHLGDCASFCVKAVRIHSIRGLLQSTWGTAAGDRGEAGFDLELSQFLSSKPLLESLTSN